MTPTAFLAVRNGVLVNLACVEKMEDVHPVHPERQRIRLRMVSGKEMIYTDDEAERVRGALLFLHAHYVAVANTIAAAQNNSGIVVPGRQVM